MQILQRNNVIKKTIVYIDTVLNIKELGENIVLSTLTNVKENELEKCLKIIFDNNPRVLFNTIQYSRNNECIYFYTDSFISTNEWYETKINRYGPIANTKEILNEIKSTLLLEENNSIDAISLYDIVSIVRRKKYEYEKLKDYYEERLNYLLHDHYSISYGIILYNFDYENHELSIGFSDIDDDYNRMTFSKQDGDLYLKESEEILYKDKLFFLFSSILSSLYDEFLKYEDFFNQSVYEIKTINAKFLVKINEYGVELYIPSNKLFEPLFSIDAHSNRDVYNVGCNSGNVINTIKGSERELFKKVIVRINECPKWMQEELYELRKKQLQELQIEEEKKRNKEENKGKRLALIKRIFPFFYHN